MKDLNKLEKLKSLAKKNKDAISSVKDKISSLSKKIPEILSFEIDTRIKSTYVTFQKMMNKRPSSAPHKFNDKQAKALALMCSGANVFLTGGAGTGKSHVIESFIHFYKKSKADKYKEGCLAVTGTTGLGAMLIGGQTLHSWAGIGLGEQKDFDKLKEMYFKTQPIKHSLGFKSNFSYYRTLIEKWEQIEILIIDEISMLSLPLFERLHDLACIIRGNDRSFGGIQLVVSGDFCQLPPINAKGQFCFHSSIWDLCKFKVAYLTETIRQAASQFSKLLQDIRLGMCTHEAAQLLLSRKKSWESFDNVAQDEIKPTMLFAKNKDVDRINETELKDLITTGKQYKEYEVTKIVDKNTLLDEKKIDKLTDFLIKDIEKLCFSVSSQVMLTRNLDVKSGLVNGSRGVIESFDDDGDPVVKFICGITTSIKRRSTKYHRAEQGKEVEITYKQIPLKLAWALTIHKSQGVTLDHVVTDLSDVFDYGQAYVALSRVRRLEDLYLTGIDFKNIGCHPEVKKFYKKLDASGD